MLHGLFTVRWLLKTKFKGKFESIVLNLISFWPLQFMGKWYQVAVVSTCPYYMKRKSRNPDMVAVVLQHVDSELNLTKTATSYRSDFSS